MNIDLTIIICNFAERPTLYNMNKLLSLLAILFILLTLQSCHNSSPRYVIGVSQCSEDLWRNKLRSELEVATYFNEGVELHYTTAFDDSRRQAEQIDSLMKLGIDLLIVSPNQVESLSDVIEKVYDSGIPVVLYDRRINTDKYTAFMSADNYEIGRLLALYASNMLPKDAKVVEIKGLHGSSPATERHEGFASLINVVASATGDWTEDSGEQAMEEILANYEGDIDCIMGGNDRMAVGALRALKRARRDANPIVLGVDALPGEGLGMELVRDSVLTASAIYPTQGDRLLALAVDILSGRPYEKEIVMQTSIVTVENAPILLLQNQEIVNQGKNLVKMHSRIDRILSQLDLQKALLYVSIIAFVIVALFLAIAIRAYRQKHLLAQRLMKEKEIVEMQRDELEMQRDRVIEVEHPTVEDSDTNEEPSARDREFIDKFNAFIAANISNSDLSVEDIGEGLCMSRVQLYRKTKALLGLSPVELLRKTRLTEAHRMLKNKSGSISEIAYNVGFSTPSYFTKCFKAEFGMLPGDVG